MAPQLASSTQRCQQRQHGVGDAHRPASQLDRRRESVQRVEEPAEVVELEPRRQEPRQLAFVTRHVGTLPLQRLGAHASADRRDSRRGSSRRGHTLAM